MPKKKIIFCNIGWMARYEGLQRKSDKIVGGGTYVDENERGHEVCNFVNCDDGYVYGHVENSKDGVEENINIEKQLGAQPKEDSIGGIVVVWTATAPNIGGRHIIGWYKNARVFRQRQTFKKLPSHQHRLDKIKTYIIRAKAKDAVLIPEELRDVPLGSGKGWMGQKAWKVLNPDDSPEIEPFLHRVTKLLDGTTDDITDIAGIRSNRKLDSTQKKALIESRRGQGQFRNDLIHEWKGCAVLGCNVPELLRASHIKPWKVSNDRERLDSNNGLLLLASLDAAFDSGLISFSDSGELRISSQLSKEDQRVLGLTKGMRLRMPLSVKRRAYLKYHRTEKFRV